MILTAPLAPKDWRAIMPPYRRPIQPFAAGRIAQERPIDKIFMRIARTIGNRQAGFAERSRFAQTLI
jgi:hypothetical protein